MASQISVVSSFKYLGVFVSPVVTEYITRNVESLLLKLKKLARNGANYLSVVGRAKIQNQNGLDTLTIVYTSQFPLLDSSEYIFEKTDPVFRNLIWKQRNPKIRLETLQLPIDGDGLAVPNTTQVISLLCISN